MSKAGNIIFAIFLIINVCFTGFILLFSNFPKAFIGDPTLSRESEVNEEITMEISPGFDYFCIANLRLNVTVYDFEVQLFLDGDLIRTMRYEEIGDIGELPKTRENGFSGAVNCVFHVSENQTGVLSFNITQYENVMSYKYSLYQDPPRIVRNLNWFIGINAAGYILLMILFLTYIWKNRS